MPSIYMRKRRETRMCMNWRKEEEEKAEWRGTIEAQMKKQRKKK